MIGVQRIQKAMRVIYNSQNVQGKRPLSVLLIGPSDGGKSKLILDQLPPWARVLNDFSYMTLVDLLHHNFSQKKIRHTVLVVPDFNAVISHKQSVSSLTAALLLSLLAEGISELPGVDEKTRLKIEGLKAEGITASLITGMTPELFRSKRGKWRDTGLLRRLLPVYFDYEPATVSKINSSISHGDDSTDYKPRSVDYSKVAQAVPIPEPMSVRINQLASAVLPALSWKYHDQKTDKSVSVAGQKLPFSLHKNFRTFARSHAILRSPKKPVVSQADYEALEDFSSFVRYDTGTKI